MPLLWAVTVLLGLYSLGVTLRSNKNAGTLMLWGITLLLGLVCVFHGWLGAHTRSGLGLALKIAVLAGAALLAGLMLFLWLAGRRNRTDGSEKAIIVLGAGLRGRRVSGILARRLRAALAAHTANPAALLVVSGGQGRGEAVSEAEAMAAWLEEHGVPGHEILREDKSVSTETNLLYSAALLVQHGVSKAEPIAIVTNTFHCYRAGAWARRLGFADARTRPAGMGAAALLPNYLREVLALGYMWLTPRAKQHPGRQA